MVLAVSHDVHLMVALDDVAVLVELFGLVVAQ